MADSEAGHGAAAQPMPYRVLARKYRPTTFSQLIGQPALVRTLTNAFRSGRLAQAYMLSGVRGVGKTTTARILARALNCTGADGQGGPTPEPCGVCPACTAIAEDRHLDVLEMDAASHTGVEKIRELLDGVPYRPTSARYKVYIIDEVHMLSIHSFNALLKTLEEPPPHVKFVFATTEIRKLPVTVLSRCQRFDLRRVEAAEIARHLSQIVAAEGVEAAPPALELIARAADGSVRDALSLLDQAIALGEGRVKESAVHEMLGLVDRSVTFDLFEAVMQGDAGGALRLLEEQFAAGADPALVLEDLLALSHWLTRIKVAPEVADGRAVAEPERVRGKAIASRLGMAEISRAWQMLLKGLNETRMAPVPLQAAEMVLVRLAYAARLPTPVEVIERLTASSATVWEPTSAATEQRGAPVAASQASSPPATRPALQPSGSPSAASPPVAGDPAPQAPVAALDRALQQPAQSHPAQSHPAQSHPAQSHPARPMPARLEAAAGAVDALPSSFAEVVDWIAEQKDPLLHGHLVAHVRLVRFEAGRIELNVSDQAPADLPQRLSRFLSERTGTRWLVTVSKETGAPTLLEQRQAAEAARFSSIEGHPLVREILNAFPGARIEQIRTPQVIAEDGAAEGEQWD